MNTTSPRIAESRFWKSLWKNYARSPSIALCRVPELEYASQLKLEGRTLDHCCGDAIFAQLGWPDSKFTAGCDLNEWSITKAKSINRHARLDLCDASQRLPYENGYFDLVFNNSALEHITDLDATLSEVARVTCEGGVFAFNVLNHRYFEWWPGDEESMKGYREWQPFYHAFSLEGWRERLSVAGFDMADFYGYFDEEASRDLALLDCEFSGYHIRQRPSALVSRYNSLLGFDERRTWRKRIESHTWRTAPDEGAGYFIIAKRR